MTTPSDRVMKRVRWCKMHNMNKAETIDCLAWGAKIDPALTERVWEMLSEETPQELMHRHQNVFNHQVDDGPLAIQLRDHNNQIMPQSYQVSDGDGFDQLHAQIATASPQNRHVSGSHEALINGLNDGDGFDQQPPMHAPIGTTSPQNRHASGSHEALINGLNGNIRPHFHVPSHGNEETIDRVRWLIVDCIMKFMTKKQTVELLERQENIDPSLAQAVWEVWESANPRFFKAYYTRIAVKDQVQRLINLIEPQVHAMQQPPAMQGGGGGGSGT